MKYAILSDIHGNLEAFTTVLQKCKELEEAKTSLDQKMDEWAELSDQLS